MDQFLLQLRILNEILEKKQQTLTQILNITENQKAALSANPRDADAMRLYSGMMNEKQKLIDSVNESDKVFERGYKEISAVFEAEAPKHPGLVKRMQDGVRRVTALDTRIRVQEARINAAHPKAVKTADNMSARKRVARIYEKNKTYNKNNRRADG